MLEDLVSSSAYWPAKPAARLVLRRTVIAVVLQENAKNESPKVLAGAEARASVMAPARASASDAEKDWVADVMGQEPSCVSVAAHYVKASTVVMADEYRKAGMANLRHHLQVASKVFKLLLCDTQAANLESRIPFTFIDLTHQDILMPWLPTDACSGRNDEADLTGRTDMLSKIATAVQRAEGKTRFFRKFNHWIFAFQRYAPAAIAAEQWSQVATLNHLDTISHLAERETGRNARLGTAVALHYEALFRRSLDARCRNFDPEITSLTKIEDMLLKVDEHILEIARTMIMTTLQKAGLSLDQVSGSGGGGAHGGTEFEGALLKQEARADQMRKSADVARKQAQKEKEESDRAWRLTNGDHRNSKERHRDKFWEELVGQTTFQTGTQQTTEVALADHLATLRIGASSLMEEARQLESRAKEQSLGNQVKAESMRRAATTAVDSLAIRGTHSLVATWRRSRGKAEPSGCSLCHVWPSCWHLLCSQ